MAHPAPSQLFDGSYYEALTSAPQDKASTPPPEQVLEDWETSDEIRDFSWDSYHTSVLKRLPKPLQEKTAAPALREIMALQVWIANRLPLPITRFLLHDLPVKTLWEHLNSDELRPLKHEALRGFQQTPGSLRREPVQKRIAAWLDRHPEEIHPLLLRWGLREPAPPALEAIQMQPDEATLKGRLPSILQTHGIDGTLMALAYAAKPQIFKYLWNLIQDREAFETWLSNAPGIEAPTETAPDAPAPDSESAKFWHAQAQLNTEKLAKLDAALSQIETQNARLAASDARIQSLETEARAAKAREKQSADKAAKRLAGAEKKWAEKYAELETSRARSERRLRALLTQVEELEAENKRQKKQIRHSAQGREDERKKVVALEAKLGELAPAPTDDSAAQNGHLANGRAPVDAVSTPQTTQSAPNSPVVVARPGPLDEIFEWMADGRRVRLTAREVRRLIDKNDEDRVTDIMLALEALEDSNPELRRLFLARLKEAGAHYPRVLTGRTTRVLVDASNVARFCPNRYGKGRLAHLLSMRDELQRLDCWPIEFIADASLPYYIDKPNELREMARAGELTLTDKGVEADEVLAREARKTGAYVVTNDAKFFYKVSPDYEPPRISFRVHDDLVIVDEF